MALAGGASDAAKYGEIARTYQAVLFGIVLWDWLVSLRLERQFIWQSRCTVPNVLYVISRYATLATTIGVFALNFVNLPLADCRHYIQLNCAALTVIQGCSIAILTQRAYIVSRSKVALAVLFMMLVSTVCMGFVHAFRSVGASVSDGEEGYCYVHVHAGWEAFTAVFFATPIVAHFIATAVVVWHLRQAARQKSIGRILVTDGILYLVAVEIVGLLQLAFFLQNTNQHLTMLNASALLALTSVLSCKLILHVRQEGRNLTLHDESSLSDVDRGLRFSISGETATKGSFKPDRSMADFHFTNNTKRVGRSYQPGRISIPSHSDRLTPYNSYDSDNEPLSFITVHHAVQREVTQMSEKEKAWEVEAQRIKGNGKL